MPRGGGPCCWLVVGCGIFNRWLVSLLSNMRRCSLSIRSLLPVVLAMTTAFAVVCPRSGDGSVRAAVTDSPPSFRPPPSDPLSRVELVELRRRYLEAWGHHRAGRISRAAQLYAELVPLYPAMAAPMRRDLAAISLQQGKHDEAQAWAEALLAAEGVGPDRLPFKAGLQAEPPIEVGSMTAWALLYRGEALLALGRPQVAAASFEAALTGRGRGGPSRAQLHHQWARSLERLDQLGEAYRHYLLAKRLGEGTSWGSAAASAASRLEPRLAPEERRVRDLLNAQMVEDLVADGREEEALRRISEVMASCEVPEIRQALKLNQSLCEARLAEPDDGVFLLHRLTYTPNLSGSQYWSIVHELQALLARQRDVERRVNVLRRFLATFPGAQESIQARTLLADILIDQGQRDEAEALYQEIVRLYPDNPEADDARWSLAWSRIRGGDLAGAFPILEEHAATVRPDSRAEARAVYWLGRSASVAGRPLLAQWLWIDVARRFPNSYYGAMARWRTGGGVPPALIGPPQSGAPASFPVDFASPTADGGMLNAGDDSWVVGRALLFPGFIDLLGGVQHPSVAQTLARAMETTLMGLREEASTALADARVDPRSDARALLLVSAFYHSTGYMQSGMRVGHQHLAMASVPTLHGPRELRWALAYPWPFVEHYVREGWRQGVQPALMAAMSQQESGFWPTAHSPAGARGLMQLMPKTARAVAEGMGLGRPRPPELYQPTLNVRLGARYIREMLDLFDGDVARALAAYNAGPGAVQRWGRKLGDVEDDVLIEEIPYTETRDYVRIVLRNYAGYRDVYPGLLFAASSFPRGASPISRRPVQKIELETVGEHGRGSAAPKDTSADPNDPGGLFGPGGDLDL